ncbi:MAG: hypothetical protein RIS70_824 [Planctomycetota bacterium]|jgi:hypothetical protein
MNVRSLVVPTAFLQVVVVLLGLVALAFLLREPHLEGRNANATLFEVYFKDPFLAYAYVGSVPFFVGVYQVFRLLGLVRHARVFSAANVRALRMIKKCALATIGFVAGGELFILLNSGEDRAGGVFIGALVTFGSIVVVAVAAMFERIVLGVVGGKSGNDLMG